MHIKYAIKRNILVHVITLAFNHLHSKINLIKIKIVLLDLKSVSFI